MSDIMLNPFLNEDIELFSKWYDKEHIGKWLGGPEEKDAWLDELSNKDGRFDFMRHFIVSLNGIKIGYCHYYDCYFVNDYHEYTGIDKKDCYYGIGYLIGEEEYLNKGIGKIIVKKLEEKIIEICGKEILADPLSENTISIKTLLANGFAKVKDGEYRKVLKT